MCRLTRIVWTAGIVGVSFTVALIGQEPQGLALGQLQIVATGLDTSLVAAAEMGPWLLQPGEQFIIARLRVKNPSNHWNCTTFIPRLRSADSTEWAAESILIEPSQPNGIRGLSAGDSRDVRVVFRVKADPLPTAILLSRDTAAENTCRAEWGGGYPGVEGGDHLDFVLTGLPTRTDLIVGDDGRPAARLGELLITPTAARTIAGIRSGRSQEGPRRGYRFVAVELTITNVGKLPNCTGVEARLTADESYTYTPRAPTDPAEPRLSDLLPSERRSGAYVFEVEAAVTPRWLTVRRVGAVWLGCESRSRMFDTIFNPASVRLPLPAVR